MHRNKKTRRKISKKYKHKHKRGGNPPCSTPLEANDTCKWGATKRRCMRLSIDSTPQVDDEPQTSLPSLPGRILTSDKKYPSIVDKIIDESPKPIYRVVPERAYPFNAEFCPPNIYMTDYSSRGINTCITNPKTQWPCDCPPDWYHARIDGTFVCMNPLKLTPVYLKHKPDTPPDKIRVAIYDDKNYRKIERVATLDKLIDNRDIQTEMDYIEYYEPTTARPEPIKKTHDEDADDKDADDKDADDKDKDTNAITTQSNPYQWSKEYTKQKYANMKKSIKNVMRPLASRVSKLKKNISKRISSAASSIASMSLEKMAAAAVTKRDIVSSKLRQEGLLYERRKDMNLDETNALDKKIEPLSSWVNKQKNKLGQAVDKLGLNTERCLYGKKDILTDMIIKLVLEIKSRDADPSEYEKITRKIVDAYEDEHPYLYWTTVLYHKFYPYLMLRSIDDTINSINSSSQQWLVLKNELTLLLKKVHGDVPITIVKELFLLGNNLIVSALNNDIQYLHLPFPPPSIEIITVLDIKPYTIPRSLQRTGQFNISADVEDMNRNCGIYEEFTEQSL